MGKHFIFLDHETANLNTRFGQSLQFAAVACDENFKIIDRIDIRIRRKPWVVPSPVAMAVTHTWAPTIDQHPFTEYEAMHRIVEWAQQFEPATYAYYNGFKFDEHVNRQGFFNTLLPPYRSSIFGNDRIDLLHHMQAGWLYSSNDSFVYQRRKYPQFKLGHLCDINGIPLHNAHDALADTIALARLAQAQKERDPEIWSHMQQFASKRGVQNFIDTNPIFQWGNYHYSGGGYTSAFCIAAYRGAHHFGQTGSNNYRRGGSEAVIANLAAFDPSWFDKSAQELANMMRDDDRGRAFRVIKLNEQPLIWHLPENLYGPPTEQLRELTPWQIRQLSQRDGRLRHLNADILRERADLILRNLDFCHRLSLAMELRWPEATYKGERLLEDRLHDEIGLNFSEQEELGLNRVTQAFHAASWPDKISVARQFRDLFPRPAAPPSGSPDDQNTQAKFEHGVTLFRLAVGIIYIQEKKDQAQYLDDDKLRAVFDEFTRRRLTEPVWVLDSRTGAPPMVWDRARGAHMPKVDRETGLPQMRYMTIDAAIESGRVKLQQLHDDPPDSPEALAETKRYLLGAMAYLETLRPAIAPVFTDVSGKPLLPVPSDGTALQAPASASADPAQARRGPAGEVELLPIQRRPQKPHYRLKLDPPQAA